MTKGELKRRQKLIEYYNNIIRQLTECGLEAKLIADDDEKYLSKIGRWQDIMRLCRSKCVKYEGVKQVGNDVLRRWLYSGLYGDSRYGQGLVDFMKDCDKFDTIYLISATAIENAQIIIEIKNALKFCQEVIQRINTDYGRQGEVRLKIKELTGYFFWNVKKDKVLYYEVDMGTQTWYFGK